MTVAYSLIYYFYCNGRNYFPYTIAYEAFIEVVEKEDKNFENGTKKDSEEETRIDSEEERRKVTEDMNQIQEQVQNLLKKIQELLEKRKKKEIMAYKVGQL